MDNSVGNPSVETGISDIPQTHERLKVLVLGSSGFWGRNVMSTLQTAGHDVYGASRDGSEEYGGYTVDLERPDTIVELLKATKPEVIINCAGIIDSSQDTLLNPTMTTNLLNQVIATGLIPRCIIIAGSAGEYGFVNKEDLPVNEDVPLRASSGYGLSKVKETTAALSIGKDNNLPVVIARIFNPIGPGMGSRMLTSRILGQIQEIRDGTREYIEVSRLDAERDLIDVVDAALAVKAIIEHSPKSDVYCIGTGKPTSNGELVRIMLENSGLQSIPEVKETSDKPEPLVASQADISRIHNEFGWEALRTLEETVKEIMYA